MSQEAKINRFTGSQDDGGGLRGDYIAQKAPIHSRMATGPRVAGWVKKVPILQADSRAAMIIDRHTRVYPPAEAIASAANCGMM